MIKVSIIVPVYNTEKYLSRCLDSIINQTLKEIEIICINDGSTDKSFEILTEYAKKDKRIVIINFEQNHGVSFARNKALEIAKGHYIGFVDSDDYVDLKYYEELYSYSKNYDIVRGIRVIDKDSKRGKNPYGCIIPSIIRKAIITNNKLKFPLNRKSGEDSTFKRWLYKKTNSIFECPDNGIYYHYMRREGSLSNYDSKVLS